MSARFLNAGLCTRDARRALARRRGERRRRRRLLWLAPLGLLVLAGALWGARWALTADRFAVRRVATGPYRFTDPAGLEACLRGALGASVWVPDGARRLAADLGRLPWVRRARVTRELPGTLRVEFEEWRPLLRVQPDSAGVADGAGALVLLADGRVEPFPAHLPAPQLPVLAGARLVAGGAGGWRLAPGQADSVLALVAALGEAGVESVAPVDFVVAGPDGLSLVLQGAGARLLLGGEDYAGRLRRFLAVSARVAAGATVDLRFGRRVFVDGRPDGAAAGEEGAAGGPEGGAAPGHGTRRQPRTDTARAPAGAPPARAGDTARA